MHSGKGREQSPFEGEKGSPRKGERAELTDEINVVALKEETVPLDHAVVTSLHAKQAVYVIGRAPAEPNNSAISALGEGLLNCWHVVLLGVWGGSR